MKNRKKNRKGFTLVELMVVVVIIGILTAIAIPVYGLITENAERKACWANQRTIDSAILQCQIATGKKIEDITFTDLLPNTGESAKPGFLEFEPVCPSKKEGYTITAGKCDGCPGGHGHYELAVESTTAG